MNPMSSILSASSRTRNLTELSLSPLPIRSSSLPGVATMTSAVRTALICCPIPTPPNTGTILSGRYFANPRNASLTWTQSSLVGVRMRDWTPFPDDTLLSIGSPKAAVFPEPV